MGNNLKLKKRRIPYFTRQGACSRTPRGSGKISENIDRSIQTACDWCGPIEKVNGSLSGRGPPAFGSTQTRQGGKVTLGQSPSLCVNMQNVASGRVINRPEPSHKMMLLICYYALTFFSANTRTSAQLMWFSPALVHYLHQHCHLISSRPASEVTKG